MNKAAKNLILDSIYYLKISELNELSKALELRPVKGKANIINSILIHLDIKPTAKNIISNDKFEKYTGSLDPNKYLLPGYYTSGKKYREIFKNNVGEHFKFTSYGMEWIKDQWQQNKYPSIDEFCNFWSKEFKARVSGSSFISLQTNARVRFFRDNKGLSKEKLEANWASFRNKKKKHLIKTLKSQGIVKKSFKFYG